MKYLLTVWLAFGFLAPLGAYAQSATPEAAATAYFDALKSGGFAQASQHMHPDEAQRFKEMLLPLLQAEAKTGKRAALQTFFGTKSTLPDIEKMPADTFMGTMLQTMMDATGAAVRFDRIDVLGSVREGEVAHVVTRIHMGADALSIKKMNVISAKPWKDGWKLMLTGEMQGLQQMLQRVAAKDKQK